MILKCTSLLCRYFAQGCNNMVLTRLAANVVMLKQASPSQMGSARPCAEMANSVIRSSFQVHLSMFSSLMSDA